MLLILFYFIYSVRRFGYVFGARSLALASRASSASYAPVAESLGNERAGDAKRKGIWEVLKSREPSPLHALQRNSFSHSELRSIARSFFNSKRYRHALEVLKWMESQKDFCMMPADHAMKLELIIKNYGLMEAEEYFLSIPETAAKKAACLPLLHAYVRARDTNRAETFMVKLYELGLVVSPHHYNEMMKLYLATCEYMKVPLVIEQMKRNRIPCNVLSYNLWMNACGEGGRQGVAAVEKVFRLMQNDVNVRVGWSSLATLANVYMKAGQSGKAIMVLKNAETKLSTCNRLGYFYLITLYTSLGKKEEVLRLWEASKVVYGGISGANYICILTSLVKLGDIIEAK